MTGDNSRWLRAPAAKLDGGRGGCPRLDREREGRQLAGRRRAERGRHEPGGPDPCLAVALLAAAEAGQPAAGQLDLERHPGRPAPAQHVGAPAAVGGRRLGPHPPAGGPGPGRGQQLASGMRRALAGPAAGRGLAGLRPMGEERVAAAAGLGGPVAAAAGHPDHARGRAAAALQLRPLLAGQVPDLDLASVDPRAQRHAHLTRRPGAAMTLRIVRRLVLDGKRSRNGESFARCWPKPSACSPSRVWRHSRVTCRAGMG